jgi:hypothetical protein
MNASTRPPQACRIRSGHPVPVPHRDDAVVGQPGVVRLARQPDHGGAATPRELHGEGPDTARRSGDDDRVARSGVDREHGGVRGRAGHVQRPGRVPGQPLRTRGQLHVVDHDELRVARPGVGEAEDLLAHRDPAHLRTDLHDDAGQIAALPRGERRRPAPVPRTFPDHRLAGLDPGRADRDQHLPGTGHRALHLRHPQDLDPAVLVEPHRLHRVLTALPRPDRPTTAAARPCLAAADPGTERSA